MLYYLHNYIAKVEILAVVIYKWKFMNIFKSS